jgi:hypothetical protein
MNGPFTPTLIFILWATLSFLTLRRCLPPDVLNQSINAFHGGLYKSS